MSDKPFSKLNEIDRELRQLCPPGMRNAEDIRISLICGFEKFNTRPYHNYETWSNGWRIEGFYGIWAGVVVEREDLDDAVREFVAKVGTATASLPLPDSRKAGK